MYRKITDSYNDICSKGKNRKGIVMTKKILITEAPVISEVTTALELFERRI